MALKANLVFTALGTALGASAVIGALYIIGIMDHHDEPVVVDNPSLRIKLAENEKYFSKLADNKYRRTSTTPLERIVALVWSDTVNPPQELAIHLAGERTLDFVLEAVSGQPQQPSLRFERTWVPFLDHADLTSSLDFRKAGNTLEPVSPSPVRVSAIRIGTSFYCVKKIGVTNEKECLAAAPPARVKVCIFPRPEKPEPPKICSK